jgi:hypothetical protein
VRVAYLAGKARTPQPSLRGGLVRYRPIIAVRVSGPGGTWILDGLLDSGSDDTIFPEWVAAMIGVDLTIAVEHDIQLAGRGKPLRCRFLPITLRITDGIQETYEWEAVAGFVAVPLRCPLLGQAGFLEYFDLTFQGADHSALLSPNPTFAGKRI